MTDQSADTKEKIMEVGRVLFATLGFEGTSVREIARLAEVNVASVNYHFSSKEKLFHEILLKGYMDCAADIRGFVEKSEKLEDVLVKVFNLFITKSHDLLGHFKMMMSTGEKIVPEGEDPGPPGGKYVIDMILRETEKPVAPEDLHWALKTLFSHTVHMSLMYHCCFKHDDIPFSTPKDIEAGIRRLTRVVIRELRG